MVLQELGQQWWWLWWRQLSSDRLLKVVLWALLLGSLVECAENSQSADCLCLISMGGLVSQTESICRSSSARGSARAFSRSAGGLAREMFQMLPARSFYKSWLPQKAKTVLFSMETYLFRCHIAFTGARRVDTPGWLTFPSDKCSYLSTSQIKSPLTHDSIAEHRSIFIGNKDNKKQHQLCKFIGWTAKKHRRTSLIFTPPCREAQLHLLRPWFAVGLLR